MTHRHRGRRDRRVFGYVDDMRNVGWHMTDRSKYVPNREKVWRTIAYALPRPPFWRVIGGFLAAPYSRWCLRQMPGDAKRSLELRANAHAVEHRS